MKRVKKREARHLEKLKKDEGKVKEGLKGGEEERALTGASWPLLTLFNPLLTSLILLNFAWRRLKKQKFISRKKNVDILINSFHARQIRTVVGLVWWRVAGRWWRREGSWCRCFKSVFKYQSVGGTSGNKTDSRYRNINTIPDVNFKWKGMWKIIYLMGVV